MQHDLRPVIHRQSVLEPSDQIPKSETQLEERRVGVQILADSEKLKTTYETLKQHVMAWEKVVKSAHKDIRELDQVIAESLLAIGTIENELESQCAVENLRLEELKEARLENAKLKVSVVSLLNLLTFLAQSQRRSSSNRRRQRLHWTAGRSKHRFVTKHGSSNPHCESTI